MTAILTGDIVNSRKLPSPEIWLEALKASLANTTWEIYRGDSFQVETEPLEAFLKALHIKSCIKSIKGLDVRISIGIGEKSFTAPRLSESNGEAFILSGERLEELKKEKVTLAISTASEEFNYEMNVILRLALIAIDSWTQTSSELIRLFLENPSLSQLELAQLAGKTQPSVSEALKRAHFYDILELDSLYRKKLSNLLKP